MCVCVFVCVSERERVWVGTQTPESSGHQLVCVNVLDSLSPFKLQWVTQNKLPLVLGLIEWHTDVIHLSRKDKALTQQTCTLSGKTVADFTCLSNPTVAHSCVSHCVCVCECKWESVWVAGRLTGGDLFDHLSRGVTPSDYVSGPHGQVLGGLGPEKVRLDTESCAGPSGKEELGAGVGRSPVRTRLDQTGLEGIETHEGGLLLWDKMKSVRFLCTLFKSSR